MQALTVSGAPAGPVIASILQTPNVCFPSIVASAGSTAVHTPEARFTTPFLRVFGELLGDNRKRVAMLAASSVVSGVIEAVVLAVIAQVAASLAVGTTQVNVDFGPAHFRASLPVLLAIGGGMAFGLLLLQAPIAYLPARIASDTQEQLRLRLFSAFTRASWTVQAQDREGHLQELMGNQIALSTQGTIQATSLVAYASSFCMLLLAALVLNPAAAGIVVVVSIALFAALRPISVAGTRYARMLSHAQLAHGSGVSEATRLAESTRAFGVAEAQRARMAVLIDESRAMLFRTQLLIRVVPGVYQSLVYLLLVGGLFVVYRVANGNVASLGIVVLLLVRAASWGNRAQNAYQIARQALPFLERLRAAEARYEAGIPVSGATPLSSIESIAFENVSYAYREAPALEHVTFTVHAGEAIGIAGPSGAGKSTVAQLLLQLRAPTEGRYLVNGRPAQDCRPEDWHRLVAYVPQTPQLIHASVAENIGYLREFPAEEIERAARLAGIHDEIVAWPNGYETIVGPRADAVSGGQMQRICLARALVGQPKVLLLDEPTSQVDSHSERLIQRSLLALKGEVTLFIIAHRISTLDMCNRVMVILDGKLNAFDAFTRVREDNAYYRSVAAAT